MNNAPATPPPQRGKVRDRERTRYERESRRIELRREDELARTWANTSEGDDPYTYGDPAFEADRAAHYSLDYAEEGLEGFVNARGRAEMRPIPKGAFGPPVPVVRLSDLPPAAPVVSWTPRRQGSAGEWARAAA